MPPVVLTLLQALFLLLLYVFVARAVRAVARDVNPAGAAPPSPRRLPRAAAIPKPRLRSRPQPGELVVHLPDGPPRHIRLGGPDGEDDVTFGRSPQATVLLDDPYVSDEHARIHRGPDGWLVTDLGSTNGTYLNQQKVAAPAAIAAGDQVAVGKTVVEVRK